MVVYLVRVSRYFPSCDEVLAYSNRRDAQKNYKSAAKKSYAEGAVVWLEQVVVRNMPKKQLVLAMASIGDCGSRAAWIESVTHLARTDIEPSLFSEDEQ